MNLFDIVIRNGKIIDGTGNPWFQADIGIKENRIIRIGQIKDISKSEEEIDAEGCFVSPGFIDIHTHGDLTLMPFPECESSIFQGVTTSIVGNCGWSLTPLNQKNKELVKGYFSPFLLDSFDYGWDWDSFGSFYNKISGLKFTMNIVPLVGQGTIRMAVKGFNQGKATDEEMKKMKSFLEDSMEQGAWGLSAGLGYPPGGYSDTQELVELTSVLKGYKAIFACHIRDYGDELRSAVQEVIEVGEKNNIPVIISHLIVKGENNWGHLSKTALKDMEEAREKGVEIYCDRYPYTAGCSTITQLLPLWALEGGTDKMLDRLRNKQEREKIKEDIISNRLKEDNGIQEVGLKQIVLNDVPGFPQYEGKSLEEIIFEKGQLGRAYDCLMDLILEVGGKCTQVKHFASQEDVDRVITHPLAMVMSDGWLTSSLASGKPHPRNFGTFPRFLNQYVKEKKLLTWEEAIRKITSMPATAIRLKERGLIKESFIADIVVFDPNKIKDRATYQDPKQYPEGINEVIVNGKLTVHKGKLLEMKNGKVILKNKMKLFE